MLFSHRILKKIIKENKSDRQIYNIPGDIRYDYYKENESWYAIDKDRNNLILDLSKYPSAVDKLNRYFPDETPPSVVTQPPTRSNPSYIKGDSKYKYFIDNDSWYAINTLNNNEIDLSRNKEAIDILNREFETDIVVKDDVKPAYINPNAVTKYSYPASNSKLIEDEELMEIMLDFAMAENLSWGAFIRKRNPGVEKKYAGIMEKSKGYPIYSAELHEYSTRLNDIESQFPPEVKRVFENEGYKVNDLANRSKRSKIYDKVKEQYEENARRVNPPVRFIDLFDSRGVMKEEYRPINLKDLPEKLTKYAAERGRSDVNVTSNGIVRSIPKVVYNTLSSRSNLSLHLFGLKHDIKITTNPPVRDDSLLAFKGTLLNDESALGVLPESQNTISMNENFAISEDTLRVLINGIISEINSRRVIKKVLLEKVDDGGYENRLTAKKYQEKKRKENEIEFNARAQSVLKQFESGLETSNLFGIKVYHKEGVRINDMDEKTQQMLAALTIRAKLDGVTPPVITDGPRTSEDQANMMWIHWWRYETDNGEIVPVNTTGKGRKHLVALYANDVYANAVADIYERIYYAKVEVPRLKKDGTIKSKLEIDQAQRKAFANRDLADIKKKCIAQAGKYLDVNKISNHQVSSAFDIRTKDGLQPDVEKVIFHEDFKDLIKINDETKSKAGAHYHVSVLKPPKQYYLNMLKKSTNVVAKK